VKLFTASLRADSSWPSFLWPLAPACVLILFRVCRRVTARCSCPRRWLLASYPKPALAARVRHVGDLTSSWRRILLQQQMPFAAGFVSPHLADGLPMLASVVFTWEISDATFTTSPVATDRHGQIERRGRIHQELGRRFVSSWRIPLSPP